MILTETHLTNLGLKLNSDNVCINLATLLMWLLNELQSFVIILWQTKITFWIHAKLICLPWYVTYFDKASKPPHYIIWNYTPHQRIKYSAVVNILSSFLCYSLKVQSKSVLVNPFLLKSDNTPFLSSFSNVVVVTGPSAIQYSPTDCTRLAVTMLITAHLCLCNLLSFRFRSNRAFNGFFKTPIHAGDQHQSRIR